jgi:hypothetical protein
MIKVCYPDLDNKGFSEKTFYLAGIEFKGEFMLTFKV